MDKEEKIYLISKINSLQFTIRELKYVLGRTSIVKTLETLGNDILILADPGFDDLAVRLLILGKTNDKEDKK